MIHYTTLILGLVFAGFGGEVFVRGAVGVARWSRISPGIVGATVAAFATSSPELFVSVNAAIAGEPRIALGDALGSNVVNIALILGAVLAISGIQGQRSGVKLNFPVALLAPIVTSALCLDGMISRLDGALMLCGFLTWIGVTVAEARKERSASETLPDPGGIWLAVAQCAAGLLLLVAAGHFIVSGARGIALAFGISEFVIGATVVAIGTSAPELATAIVAKLRGHDEVGLGTILGSNIFNGLFVVPLAASIHPIMLNWREVLVAFVFGIVALVCSYPSRTGFIERRRGFLLLGLYAAYLATVMQLAGD